LSRSGSLPSLSLLHAILAADIGLQQVPRGAKDKSLPGEFYFGTECWLWWKCLQINFWQ
jgi:hypothetical protein